MGSWSTSSAGPELLADVQLGTCAASAVAWCPVNGLLAVGGRQHANLACVYVLSPYCLEHKVSLAVPLQGEPLSCVARYAVASSDSVRRYSTHTTHLLCCAVQGLRMTWCVCPGRPWAAGGFC
jgi:hypothetical protein